LKAGTLPKVLPSYLSAFVPTLAMIAGLALGLETIVHYTVNPGDDSHIKAFGVNFDAASPYIWAMAAILSIGGYLVARKTWTWVGHAWDGATSVAREKGIAA
jgi:branched-chain amino acid transport system permease protein